MMRASERRDAGIENPLSRLLLGRNEKRFKGETLLLLFNSSMRNKNISYFDTILLINRNELDRFDRWIKGDQTLNLYAKCNFFLFTLYFSQQRFEYLYVLYLLLLPVMGILWRINIFIITLLKGGKISNGLFVTRSNTRDVLRSNLLKKRKKEIKLWCE